MQELSLPACLLGVKTNYISSQKALPNLTDGIPASPTRTIYITSSNPWYTVDKVGAVEVPYWSHREVVT